jgi:hypothetical protein
MRQPLFWTKASTLGVCSEDKVEDENKAKGKRQSNDQIQGSFPFGFAQGQDDDHKGDDGGEDDFRKS